MNKTFLITGGAGFIGSAVIRYLIKNTKHKIINVDKLTYAGNLSTLESIKESPLYFFEKVDICDKDNIKRLFELYNPDIIMHLAAESHVDRSIVGSSEFIQTNIVGTHNMLEKAREYYENLTSNRKRIFRFHHISTDEVYGDLGNTYDLFTEETSYAPNSPYAASKASSDHLVRAWFRTYSLPIIITNCSNNYGSFQYPEKLIPVVILNALKGKSLPIYGDGKQIRDWLYVDDHAEALVLVAQKGILGNTYNIGGFNEKQNIEVVEVICDILDKLVPQKKPYHELIEFVTDRLGHDMRYAIDATKIKNELGWQPKETFSSGLKKTVVWYLDNLDWCDRVMFRSIKEKKIT